MAVASAVPYALCKSAPCCGQITTPAPHHSVFTDRSDVRPTAQPTRKALKALMCVGVSKQVDIICKQVLSLAESETREET